MTRTQLANMMTEDRGPDSLDSHVRRLLADLGLWGYHVRNSRGSERGWPDWVIIGNRVLFRELKTERGALSVEQREVGAKLQRAGQSWGVWRPRDLLSGKIVRELTGISMVQGRLWGDAS